MSRPFKGIKVIDITHVLAGPFSTNQLALLGADVIKVENPEDPDQARTSGSDHLLNECNMGTSFLTTGSNKRSFTVDLKTKKGQEIIKALAKVADVLVENYRSGALNALGIGYEDIKKINPTIIYCSLTAWGQEGPRGQQTGYDQVIQGYSGMMSITGNSETGPMRCGPQLIDFATGTTAAFAIASALFQRERTGNGQYIDGCLTDTAFILMGAQITGALRTGKKLDYQTPDRGQATHSEYMAEDSMLLLGASNHRQHSRFWELVGQPERANKSDSYRRQNRTQEAEALRKLIATKKAQEWEDFLQENHIPAARQRSVEEAISDPQVKYRNIFHCYKDGSQEVDGEYTVPVAAFKYAEEGPRVDSPPPTFGQHNTEILKDLGYTSNEIAELKKAKIIG